MKKYRLVSLLFILAPAVLVGCGGGDEQPCSSASSLFLGFSYKFAGISSSGDVVGYTPGVAFSNTPTVVGVPESCNAFKRFTIEPQIGFGSAPLPGAVTLDPVTGTITGTLAVPLGSCNGAPSGTYVNTTNPVCSAGGFFSTATFNIALSLAGFSDLKKSVTFINR